jgi:hypothetical protein
VEGVNGGVNWGKWDSAPSTPYGGADSGFPLYREKDFCFGSTRKYESALYDDFKNVEMASFLW